MEACDLDAALIRRTPFMPPTGACRIDLYKVFEGTILQMMEQEPFSQRASTDVSHADEKDPINRNTSKISTVGDMTEEIGRVLMCPH